MMSKNKVIDIKLIPPPNDSIGSPEPLKKFVATFIQGKSVFLGHAHPDRGKFSTFSHNGFGRQMRAPKCAETST